MSFDVSKNGDGETFVLPLELPMFEGSTADLCRQAEVCLASTLRHAAICDWIVDNLDMGDDVVRDAYNQEHAQMSSQLTSLFMTLAGISENMGIDIMQEIWDMPWEV